MADSEYLDGDSGLLYYFRVVDGKEILGLTERRVRAACTSDCSDLSYILFQEICEKLGIEIGTP